MALPPTDLLSQTPDASSMGHQMPQIDFDVKPWSPYRDLLRHVSLRPTRQRMVLAWILFSKGNRHVTAEMLYDEAIKARIPVSLATIYKALSDPTRVQMLHLLTRTTEPICVCDFTAAFDLGQPTVSHHLAKLKAAGFIDSFKRGVWAFYRIRDDMPEAAQLALSSVP